MRAKYKSREVFNLLVRRQVGVRSHMVSFGQSLVGRTRESYNDYNFSHVMKPEKSVSHLSITCGGESYNSESYNGGSTVCELCIVIIFPVSIVQHDIDGDGLLDILLVSSSGEISFYSYDGTRLDQFSYQVPYYFFF
jgi:hypothetical protein